MPNTDATSSKPGLSSRDKIWIGLACAGLLLLYGIWYQSRLGDMTPSQRCDFQWSTFLFGDATKCKADIIIQRYKAGY
jgi:hypothetical protein